MELYEKDSYLNHNIPYMINGIIYEYDIKSAGYNLTKYYKLLSDDIITNLSQIPTKKALQVKLGLIQRENHEYRDKLRQAFIDIRKLFFEVNNIKEEDIHSIKKDAIFLYRPVKQREFGNVNFAIKNIYSSYYLFDRYEYYFYNNKIDIKGISDNKKSLHKDFMLQILINIFAYLESNSITLSKDLLFKFISAYKKRDLTYGYYRELNNESNFIIGDNRIKEKDEDNLIYYSKDMININYNIDTYLLPLVKILL